MRCLYFFTVPYNGQVYRIKLYLRAREPRKSVFNKTMCKKVMIALLVAGSTIQGHFDGLKTKSSLKT